MKFAVATGDRPASQQPSQQSNESTEQIYHPDLGWSPKWERVPTRAQVKAAILQWIGKETAGGFFDYPDRIEATLRGEVIASVKVRD